MIWEIKKLENKEDFDELKNFLKKNFQMYFMVD